MLFEFFQLHFWNTTQPGWAEACALISLDASLQVASSVTLLHAFGVMNESLDAFALYAEQSSLLYSRSFCSRRAPRCIRCSDAGDGSVTDSARGACDSKVLDIGGEGCNLSAPNISETWSCNDPDMLPRECVSKALAGDHTLYQFVLAPFPMGFSPAPPLLVVVSTETLPWCEVS